MADIKTYPEMNAQIISLLRLSEDPICLYAAQRIEELEADQKTVVHGKWIKEYKDQVNSKCSICGKEVGRKSNYCPNCGAKMSSEVET